MNSNQSAETPKHITGFGGFFFRSKDPTLVGQWYEKNFGINSMQSKDVWYQEAGPTVFAPFEENTSYFGNAGQQFMINFRVTDLDGFIEQLSASGVKIDEKRDSSSIGKFAWIYDPEGNKIELWEPADKSQWKDDC